LIEMQITRAREDTVPVLDRRTHSKRECGFWCEELSSKAGRAKGEGLLAFEFMNAGVKLMVELALSNEFITLLCERVLDALQLLAQMNYSFAGLIIAIPPKLGYNFLHAQPQP